MKKTFVLVEASNENKSDTFDGIIRFLLTEKKDFVFIPNTASRQWPDPKTVSHVVFEHATHDDSILAAMFIDSTFVNCSSEIISWMTGVKKVYVADEEGCLNLITMKPMSPKNI